MAGAADHWLVSGSYPSTVFRIAEPVDPPIASTLPDANRTPACPWRAPVIEVANVSNSALARTLVPLDPPETSTWPRSMAVAAAPERLSLIVGVIAGVSVHRFA